MAKDHERCVVVVIHGKMCMSQRKITKFVITAMQHNVSDFQ